MIISLNELEEQVKTTSSDSVVIAHIKAIEAVIRAFTNNNFQQRGFRFAGSSEGLNVYGVTTGFNVGDTIEISESVVNDGLHTITAVTDEYIQLDEYLNDAEFNLVTKVVYPADVKQCAVDLYKWRQNMGDKVGLKSETISRHSVTFEDSATLYMGYPIGILNGLKLHRKARC